MLLFFATVFPEWARQRTTDVDLVDIDDADPLSGGAVNLSGAPFGLPPSLPPQFSPPPPPNVIKPPPPTWSVYSSAGVAIQPTAM